MKDTDEIKTQHLLHQQQHLMVGSNAFFQIYDNSFVHRNTNLYNPFLNKYGIYCGKAFSVWDTMGNFGTVGRPDHKTRNNHSSPDFWNSNIQNSIIKYIHYFMYFQSSSLLYSIHIINNKLQKCQNRPKIGTIFYNSLSGTVDNPWV